MSSIAMESDPRLRVTQRRVITSEWIKFRSLRSTWWSVLIALLISIGLGILFSDLRGHDAQVNGGFEADQTALSLRGFYLAQLAVGVLGVLSVTGEYSTGMIRATLTAVPKRMPVWVAKIAIFASVIFLISLTAAFVAFLGGQAVLHGYVFHGQVVTGPGGNIMIIGGPNSHGVTRLGVSLSHPGALRAIFGAALYTTGIGLLGLGCGFMIRNAGGAIAGLFGLVLVLPLLAQALPFSLQQHVAKYLPLSAGTAAMNTVKVSDQLSPWSGLAVFALYVVAALGIGLLILRRRDA